MEAPAKRRAVTILSGFLGSGKTTLLRRYLQERDRTDIAVIINEYGTVGLDYQLVRMVKEKSVLLKGGCVCCTRRDDLVRTLRELLDAEEGGALPRLAQVVIETSGLADPVPVLFTLTSDPVLKYHFAASAVIVTLDALNAEAAIDSQPEVRKQVVAADRIVITKPDLAHGGAIEHLRAEIQRLNPAAEISTSCLGDGFATLAPPAGPEAARVLAVPAIEGSPHAEVQTAALGFSAPLDWPAFGVWLGMLLQAHGPDLLRIKGLLDVGAAGPVVLNVAQHVVHPPEHLASWPEGERRPYLVFITRRIDPERIARSLETFQRAGGRRELRVSRIT